MKQTYEKPQVFTENISVVFAGACCTDKSPVGANTGTFSTLTGCLPDCHWDYNSYAA